MARSMRAAVVVGPGRVVVEAVPLPRPGPGEVRIRLEGCGVCASNVEPWQGLPWLSYPMAPGALGHEGWGTVDAVGEGAAGVQVGDRVAALSYGAYAEYDLARADAVVPIPAELSGIPCPGEAIGCAVNVFRRSRIRSGETVAVVGVGFIGALLVRLARRAGARVIAVSRRRFALETAARMGADACVALEDPAAALDRVREVSGSALSDCVVEAAGKQVSLDLAGELVKEHGRLIIAGYHQDGPRTVNLQLWNWRGIDVINAHERRQEVALSGIREAFALMGRGELDPLPLLTHRFPLEQLGAALDAAASRPEGFMKAVVVTG